MRLRIILKRQVLICFVQREVESEKHTLRHTEANKIVLLKDAMKVIFI